jgi:hypothetical protein
MAVGGCSAAEETSVAAAARDFTSAAVGNPRLACAMLAPDTRHEVEQEGDGSCVDGLRQARPASPGSLERVTVAAGSAQAVFADEVVFLARFDTGWQVTAAGCSRTETDPARPYECDIKAG